MSMPAMNLALTVVPADMHFRPTQDGAQRALALFRELFPNTAGHQAMAFDGVRFINPELFASKAHCPTCGVASERYGEPGDAGRQWFAHIDRVTLDAPVDHLRTTLPACGHQAPFTSLTFEWPAGFASFALVAPYTYWDDEVMHEDLPLQEQLHALGAALGAPVRAVRSYFAALPADRRRFEGLMAADEAARIAAADGLDALEHGHFEDHPIASSFPEEHSERLLAAFHASGERRVKAWILYLLSETTRHTPHMVAAVAAHLAPGSHLLEPCLSMIQRAPRSYAHLTPAVVALADHAERNVRWRCAIALRSLPLDIAPHLDALHALMLDTDANTRLYAVLALHDKRATRQLDEASRAVLQKVIDMDGKSAAAGHARKLLEGAAK
jgi:hypothetical protein